MILRITYLSMIVGLVTSCDFGAKKRAELLHEVDSLKLELATSLQTAEALELVGVMLDTIDNSRNVLRTKMLEGTSYDQYTARLKDLNDHIKKTEAKINELERSAKSSRSAARNYASTIRKMRKDLASRNDELSALQRQVDKYRNENENLVHTVELQKAEIEDKLSRLATSKEEINDLEKQIGTLLVQSKIDEAEAYFLRAQAVEMAANRTKFAPRKKRETRKEALELYRMAAFYGKTEAEARIAALEEKI